MRNRDVDRLIAEVENERRTRHLYEKPPTIEPPELDPKAGTEEYVAAVLGRLAEGPATKAECEDAARGLLLGRDSGMVRAIVWERLEVLGVVVGPTKEAPAGGGRGRPRMAYALSPYGFELWDAFAAEVERLEALKADRRRRVRALPEVRGGVIFAVEDEDEDGAAWTKGRNARGDVGQERGRDGDPYGGQWGRDYLPRPDEVHPKRRHLAEEARRKRDRERKQEERRRKREG